VRNARVVFALGLISIAGSASAQFGPRESIEVDAFGGAAAVTSDSDWGEARYGVGGIGVRYVRSRDAAHFGMTLASTYGERYALDQPSFEEYGSVADRFAATYVGGAVGFDSHAFAIEVTGGGVVETIVERGRRSIPGWGASGTFRIGPTHFVAVVLKAGSTDGWIADRNGFSVAFLHDHRRFRGLVSIGTGFVLAPSLLNDRAERQFIRPESRRKVLYPLFPDIVGHVELAGHVRDFDVGVDLWVGTQLPLARVFYRQRFGAEPRIARFREDRRPREVRGRYGHMPPR